MAPAMKSAMKSKAMKAAKAMTKSQLADQLATKSELKKKDVLSGPAEPFRDRCQRGHHHRQAL